MTIKKSEIAGLGLFANRAIIADEKIYYDVPDMTYEEYIKIRNGLSRKESELFLTTEDRVYDIRNSELRYMNHSKTPNISWEDGLYITALRNIKIDEELTIDYNWTEEEEREFLF